MKHYKWFVVDDDNNTFAGPIDSLAKAAATADEIAKLIKRKKIGIVRQDELVKRQKEYAKLIAQRKIFDMFYSSK